MANGLLVLHATMTNKKYHDGKTVVYPQGPETLSGFWDAVTGAISSGFKKKFKEQLDSAQAKLEDKIGTFLTTNQKIMSLKSRADVQKDSNNPQVASQAQAVSAKASGLLNQYANIKNNAITLINKLMSLKTQLATDPALQFENPLNMGSRVVQLFNNYKDSLGQTIAQSADMLSQINRHISDTNRLQSDVDNLESFAQGKGLKATFQGIGSGLATNALKPVVTIATVGLLVYFLAPSFLGRMRRS